MKIVLAILIEKIQFSIKRFMEQHIKWKLSEFSIFKDRKRRYLSNFSQKKVSYRLELGVLF